MIGRTLRLLETDGMNMRIAPYLLLIILVFAGYFLPISNVAQDPNRTNTAAHQLTPSQFDPDTDLSRPIFDHITGADVEIIRERNDTLGFGAIIRAEVNQNITIFYTLVNGNNETDLRLYADVPNQNLTTSRAGFTNQSLALTHIENDFEINYTIPYDKTIPVIANASIATYSVSINVTTNYITFIVAVIDGDAEDVGNAPVNLITSTNGTEVQSYWSSMSEDDFYIQDEEIVIQFVAYNATINAILNTTTNTTVNDTYGLRYTTIANFDWVLKNFTDPLTADIYNTSINIGVFPIDNELMWRSIAYVYDEILNETRQIEKIESQIVEIGDGSPILLASVKSDFKNEIFTNGTLYTFSENITTVLNATVPKGNITNFEIFLNGVSDRNVTAVGNVSTNGESFNFTNLLTVNEIFNITIQATTNKDLKSNLQFRIVIDTFLPIISLFSLENGEQSITTKTGQVTFKFEFSDLTAGVRVAFLDLGDGFSVEVTDLGEYTYIYHVLDVSYDVTLTVWDWSSNEQTKSFTITLESESLNPNPPYAEFYLFVFLIIAAIAAYIFRERLTNMFNR